MRFIVLGDLHFTIYANPEHTAARDRVFEALFRQVAAHNADIVFAIGDTTNRGTLPELTAEDEVAARAGLKLVRLTGNHDCDRHEKAEIAEFFLGGRASVSPDELYTSFDLGGVRFVLLDTSRVKCSSTNWSGFASDEQLAWFAEEIERYNRDENSHYLVVMAHHPLYGTTQYSRTKWLNIDNSEAFQVVMARLKRPPALYINGHNHSNSLFGPDAQGWYYLQAGAPLRCEGYRLITADGDGLHIETVDFDLSDPALREAFETTRYNIDDVFMNEFPESLYGEESDRTRRISPASVA